MPKNPRLAARYAKSIFDLALEKGELEKVYEDMILLNAICRKSRDFVGILHSPIIPTDKKEKILGALFKGRVSPLTATFTRLLVSKGRENNFLEITNAFIEQYKEYNGIQTLRLTTAYPVSDEIKEEIVSKVKNRVNAKELEVEEKVNPDVIGGFRLELKDYLLDATVLHVLEKARTEFQNKEYVFRLR
jgi:F-type H+-transporting ATPase subunit delta